MEIRENVYRDFTETSVWKLAMEVAERVFELTQDLPKKEDYGLTSQIRRASVSISANIAEAYGRSTSLDKSKFYDYSRGSAFETKSLLLYGLRVNYFIETTTLLIIKKINSIILELNKIKISLINYSKKQAKP